MVRNAFENEPKSVDALLQKELTHNTGRKCGIGTNFSINFYQSLIDNFFDLVVRHCIMQFVAQENNKWQRFSRFMRA